ncbi:TPA: hypothetical protein RKT18_005433 [Bacillus cereus]|nr:hypothetical protein [Bacillus cereus]
MDFISNPWFVGIAGGIVSGVIVFFITTAISNKISKKDYYNSVKEVNFKVSKMLIMSISEGKIPNPQVVSALLSSLAKRNNILLKDINTVEETYNDLVTELFETNFIPVEKKQTLANELIDTKESLKQTIILDENKDINEDEKYLRYRSTRFKYLYILGVTVSAYMFLILTLLDVKKFSLPISATDDYQILAIAFGTFTIVLSLLILITTKLTHDKRKELRKKINKIDKNT